MPEMYFQPSIVLFADAAGKAIYDLLCSCGLFERIHEPLKDAICFIYHDESEGDPIYTCRRAKDEEEKAEKISVLKDAILHLENKISLDRAGEDYAIPTTIPTIYIVGTPETRFVVNGLRDKGVWNGDISCLFLCEPDDQQQVDRHASDAGSDAQTPDKLERAMPPTGEWTIWAHNKRVTFCYFYGDVPRYLYDKWGKSTFEYAAAEALFALIVPGIAAHPRFKELVQSRPDVPYQYGTLSTCIVSVPRKEIREACYTKVSALLLDTWLKYIQTRAKDQEKAIEKEADKPLAYIRKIVMGPEVHSKTASKSRLFYLYHRVVNNKRSSPLELLPWTPLAACQENTFKGEQQETYLTLQKKLVQHTGAIFQHVSQVEQGDLDGWVERVNKQHQEVLEGSTKAHELKRSWLSTVEEIWNQLQAAACIELQTAIDHQLVTNGLLRTIDFCELFQSKLKELHEQIESKPQTGSFRAGEAQEASRNTGAGQIQAKRVREEELRSEIKERIYMAPSSRTSAAMAVVSALTLALPAWLLVSAFTGKLVLLLPLAFVLCLICVAIECRIYYKKAYVAPLREKQEQMLNLYKDELVPGCEETERAQRIALVEKLQSELSSRAYTMSLVTSVVPDLKEDLERKAKHTIDELFSSARGKRDCFLGDGIYLQNEKIAYETLGFRSASSEETNKPVGRIYKSVVGEGNQNAIGPGNLFTNAEMYLNEAFRDQASSPEQVREQLLRFLEDCLDKRPRDEGTDLSSSDFRFEIHNQVLWEAIQQRLVRPPLCRLQQKADHAQEVFLCTSSRYASDALSNLVGATNIEEIQMHDSLNVEEGPTSDTSPWILLAELCIHRSSLPTD